MAAMAVLSTRSGHISRFGLRMDNFILSRIRSLSEPFLSRAMAVLSEPMAVLSMAVLSTKRFIKVEDQASGRNGRFINQKWAVGQLGRFHIAPHKEFIGQVEPF